MMTKDELKLKITQHDYKNNHVKTLEEYIKTLEEYIKVLENQFIPRQTLTDILYQGCCNAGIRGGLTLFEKQVIKVILKHVSIDEMLDEFNEVLRDGAPMADIAKRGIPYVKKLINN